MKTDELCGPRDEVYWFASEMERELRLNDHKGGWYSITTEHLLTRLTQEVGELRRAIATSKPREAIIAEAADVANFAMMIAHEARRGRSAAGLQPAPGRAGAVEL